MVNGQELPRVLSPWLEAVIRWYLIKEVLLEKRIQAGRWRDIYLLSHALEQNSLKRQDHINLHALVGDQIQ
jgi:hypothetical protein